MRIIGRSPRRPAFFDDTRGAVMMMFSLALPVLLGVAWIAVNFSYMNSEKANVQAAADAAALGAAKQLSLSNQNLATVQNIASNLVTANLPSSPYLASADQVSTTINSTSATPSVTVSVTRTLIPMMSANFGITSNVITSSSTAQYKSSPICVLVLDPFGSQAFYATSASSVNAPNCAIISNSTSSTGVVGQTRGTVTAAKVCSAGGFTDTSGHIFKPSAPIPDCPQVSDPLKDRAPPPNAGNGCDHTNLALLFTHTLSPGVYCGGITILVGTITMTPGDYIIRGGTLKLAAGTTIKGAGVGIYLTGGAKIDAQPLSGMTLSAPSDPNDPMVGLVFWEDRNNSSSGQLKHLIYSEFAQNLEGTIYIPQGILYVGGSALMGAQANYTIIVAEDLVTDQNAQVILNTNYSSSDVPVPAGVGLTGGAPTLSQ